MKYDKSKSANVCACGYSDHSKSSGVISEKVAHKDTPEIAIQDKKIETLPITEAQCPKCGHKKAYWWTKQTRSSDEPETQFFRCEACDHTWRDYR
jgi:DNA-directed RNA polymerase subunit M